MVEFLIRLVIAVLIIWLTQTILGVFNLKEPAPRIIFAVVVVFSVLWVIFGGTIMPMGSFK